MLDSTETTVCAVPGGWRPDATRQFTTPWAARAFGIVLAAFEQNLFTAADFQQALIRRISLHEREVGPIDDEDVYYSRWIEALMILLMSRDVIGEPQLAAAEAMVRQRLVVLEREHAHGHEHGHDHGRPVPTPVYRESGL
jgi:nitrile hydratase accessory protein